MRKRAGQRSRTVREDWSAWIPNEMDQLFDATRQELESSNFILSITLGRGPRPLQRRAIRLRKGTSDRHCGPVRSPGCSRRPCDWHDQGHGAHFGTLPNVKPLSAANFRGATAQRISRMDSLLAKVLFRERTRFFHKLYSLGEIIEELQKEARAIVAGISEGASEFPDRAWQTGNPWL